jgi:hypothetical protein
VEILKHAGFSPSNVDNGQPVPLHTAQLECLILDKTRIQRRGLAPSGFGIAAVSPAETGPRHYSYTQFLQSLRAFHSWRDTIILSPDCYGLVFFDRFRPWATGLSEAEHGWCELPLKSRR